jgi:hypothetical protein
LEEDEAVEENGRHMPVKKVKALDADTEAETPALIKACD